MNYEVKFIDNNLISGPSTAYFVPSAPAQWLASITGDPVMNTGPGANPCGEVPLGIPKKMPLLNFNSKKKKKPALHDDIWYHEAKQVFHLLAGCAPAAKKIRKLSKIDALTVFTHFKESWCGECRKLADKTYGKS